MKVAAYLRVSSQGQLGNTGFARQAEKISKFAVSRGWDCDRFWLEYGRSGTAGLESRPALAELLEVCKEPDGPKVILVENGDRWAREAILGLMLYRDCQDHGIQVFAADGGVELTATEGDATSLLIQQVLAAVAEFNKSQAVARLRLARQRLKRESGGQRGKEGTKPFGQLPAEQQYLEKIRKLVSLPCSCDTLACMLQDAGIPTRNGGPWTRSTAYKLRRRYANG
jgi:DNA invertase Pin-like site-specific DNA recombinase